MLSRAAFLPYVFSLLVLAVISAPAASAQTADPVTGSPPSAVYQIPLEGARADAAPHKPAKKDSRGTEEAGGGDSSESSSGTVYRSENNFGSSSEVPGVSPKRRSKPADSRKKASPEPAQVPASTTTGNVGETSIPAAVGLLVLIALAGVGIGLVSHRSARVSP